MKDLLKTVVWLGLVAAVASLVVLAPQLRCLISPRSDAALRTPAGSAPIFPESSSPQSATPTQSTYAVSTPDRQTKLPPVTTEPLSPRERLATMTVGPQTAAPERAVADLFEPDPSVSTQLRQLLAANDSDEPPASAPASVDAARAEDVDQRSDVRINSPDTDREPGPQLGQSLADDGYVLEPAAAVPSPPPAPWPRPAKLVGQLEALAGQETVSEWATRASEELDRLHRTPALDDPEAGQTIRRLVQLVDTGEQQAERLKQRSLRVSTLRAGYALARRLAIWQAIHAAAAAGPGGVPANQLDRNALLAALQPVESLLQTSHHCQIWRQFLLADELRAATVTDDATYAEARQIARVLLARIESPRLVKAQRDFLANETFTALREQLQSWAAEPVDYGQLVRLLEAFEDTPTTTMADELAGVWNQSRRSPQQEVVALARKLDVYYRNANVRFAVSETLLNRLVPIVKDMNEEVDDMVLGTRVIGQSRTSTRLVVRLIPDPRRWRMGLEAEGEVNSRTQSRVGLVRLFNQGESLFLARQLLQVGHQGVRLDETQAGADADTRLTGVRTDVDVVPLLGPLVRRIAQSQHEAQRYAAAREVEHKIAFRVRRRFGEEVKTAVAKAEQQFNEKVLSPLKALDLDPVATQMMTTEQRLIMRCRLAGYDQMAACTPRPRAPADSLLSVQIHQSSANNLLQQLELDGNSYELHDLYRRITQKFQQRELEVPEDIPTGVTVTFADTESVRVHFEDGRVLLSIRLAKLKTSKRTWRDFEVRGYYRPESETSNADLVREDTIELIGDGLGIGDRIALAGVFSKVLSKNRKLQLISERLVNEPRLDDVRVTQFAVDNGWIGVALASREGRRDLVARPASRPASHR